MNLINPFVLDENSDYTVIFKPAGMHCVPLVPDKEETLLDWYKKKINTNNDLKDSGLMHRLDFETHGLVLFAKNQKSYEFIKNLQNNGEFVKEYSAVCTKKSSDNKNGFPPPPDIAGNGIIMSYFRPYGPGRKLVRPVIDTGSVPKKEVAKDKGGFYRTEIVKSGKDGCNFTVRIKRGFRHQIRCHLSWIGYPILNDPLYNNSAVDGSLALRAHAVLFTDPSTGEKRECRIEPLE